MKLKKFGSTRFKEVCTGRLLPLLVFASIIGCSRPTETTPVGASSQAVISDELHGGGSPGFLWEPPIVQSAPKNPGVLVNVPATVRIDQLNVNGTTALTLATFVQSSGPQGQALRFVPAGKADDSDGDNDDDDNGFYLARWLTHNAHLSAQAKYRINVYVPAKGGGTRRLGYSDLIVANDRGTYKSIDSANNTPLLNGTTLRIKFRINPIAVDADGDGVFDWVDNCPTVANANQKDTVGNGLGDACRCLTVACRASDQCHVAGTCAPTTGVCSNPAANNGTSCALANATATCQAGACAIDACTAGYGDCDSLAATGCETNITTTTSCGACGNTCAGGANATAVCTAGACALSCSAGYANCDGNAANGCELATSTDVSNCGGCGIACANEEGCVAGGCTTAICQAGFADCDKIAGNGCEVTLATNASNCGGCNIACSFANGTATCAAGNCALAGCADGYADCDGKAVNGCETTPDSDVNNCGKCGNACALPNASPVCTSGACAVASCTTGYADCDGAPANGCEVTLVTDTRNCGACGTVCAYANAGALCQKSACALGACNAGFADCDQLAGNGCETTPATDVKNCGACGTVCVFGPHSNPSCGASKCAIVCDAGWADCDGNPANGCEVDTTSDIANCGACNNGCNLNETCQTGACSATVCVNGYGNCDTNADNGCESTLATDVNNCNGCGNACSFSNAPAECIGGACGFTVCAAGYGDCDSTQANGCEIALLTDVSHCGGCDTRCSFANAGASCAGGACVIGDCATGYANCDGDATNGCEATPANDVKNCGVCGKVCPSGANSTATCTAGGCGIACAAGYADCDGDPSNGCEQSISDDNNNCGACGKVCGDHTSCMSGACSTSKCQVGFADCNANPSDGCEVSLITDVNHCGTCTTACAYTNAGAACVAGACAMTACSAGYSDCDKSSANGCEDPTASDVNNCGACANVCAMVANATSTCSSATCGYACASGYLDCNHTAGDGCEINSVSDIGNCGGCNVVCPTAPAHEIASCIASTCVASCATGYADCNKNATDGCEIDTTSDSKNCGACGVVCGNNTTCKSGVCSTAVCQAGYADCNKDPLDGCEIDTTKSVTNCGGCGIACSYTNAAASCTASACAMAACTVGYADCDNNSGNGCETNLNTSASNCGGCKVQCDLGSSCGGGVCSCPVGKTACNGTCKNLLTDARNCGACGKVCADGHLCVAGACGGGKVFAWWRTGVEVLDPSTYAIVDTLFPAAANAIFAGAITTDNKTLYLTDINTSNIYAVNTTTDEVTTYSNVTQYPPGTVEVAVGATGLVYTANSYYNYGIRGFNPANQSIFGTLGGQGQGVALNPVSGVVYGSIKVSASRTTIYELDPGNLAIKRSVNLGLAPGCLTPSGAGAVAVSPDGNTLYMQGYDCNGLGMVTFVDTARLTQTSTVALGFPLQSGSSSIVASRDGKHVYVSDNIRTSGGGVSIVDTATGAVQTARLDNGNFYNQAYAYTSSSGLAETGDGTAILSANFFNEGTNTNQLSVVSESTGTVTNVKLPLSNMQGVLAIH